MRDVPARLRDSLWFALLCGVLAIIFALGIQLAFGERPPPADIFPAAAVMTATIASWWRHKKRRRTARTE